MDAIESMLSAVRRDSGGVARGRATLGVDSLPEIRALSDARALACPVCSGPVVLRAGARVAAHFAHLPGAVCSHSDSEPETEEHRAGKAQIAEWLRVALPGAEVVVEAQIAETGQRVDVLAAHGGRRYAFEFQCADLSAREWVRRRNLYARAGVLDLWLLGASRLRFAGGTLYPLPLERAMAERGERLLFLDSTGCTLPPGSLARFRPASAASGRLADAVPGRLAGRPLCRLPFPAAYFGSRPAACGEPLATDARRRQTSPPPTPAPASHSDEDARLLRWLRLRHGVRDGALPEVFGIEVAGASAIGCSPEVWQACVYYRWIHGRRGEAWWLEAVNVWARKHLPVADRTGRRVYRALRAYQDCLAAAGFLTGPFGRDSARVLGDLSTLSPLPAAAEIRRLAAYRRLRDRD